jgi:hypothetical protein
MLDEERFIFWRHDMDLSLNPGLASAKIEQQEGIKATYFLNPHCEYYNIAEKSQHKIIMEILSLGHDVGLHFDAAFYGVRSETDLDFRIAKEAAYLRDLFGVLPTAFSFHNPVAAHLRCEADYYGGLVNCYSKRFKTDIAYCSDSNGYWRFRRLYDVLSEAKDARLQVLTHPGWWQEKSMPPRQRIFTSAYGRAAAIMRAYDQGLEEHGRLNHGGFSDNLKVLRNHNLKDDYEICDFLWSKGAFQTLFMALWRVHAAQINRMYRVFLQKEWHVPPDEVNVFFGEEGVFLDSWRLFELFFDQKWQEATGTAEIEHKSWGTIRDQLINGQGRIAPVDLESGCIHLCRIIQNLAEWGTLQTWAYDGLVHLDSIAIPRQTTDDDGIKDQLNETIGLAKDFSDEQWENLKKRILESTNSNFGLA